VLGVRTVANLMVLWSWCFNRVGSWRFTFWM